jgi:hypothetical protein
MTVRRCFQYRAGIKNTLEKEYVLKNKKIYTAGHLLCSVCGKNGEYFVAVNEGIR